MLKNKKVLLISPPYANFYKDIKIKAAAMYPPPLNLATLAGQLMREGHLVEILDLNIEVNPDKAVRSAILSFKPDYAGLTFNTPLVNQAKQIAELIKEINPEIVIIAGGTHTTALPEEVLSTSRIDIAVEGEGDFTLTEIVNGMTLDKIGGITYKKNGGLKRNERKEYIKDLNSLAYPAWNLFDLNRYKTNELMTKATPAGWIETGRGCVFTCCYCNKNIFGRNFRMKSPERVVDEIEKMLRYGFKEIHIADDCFTINLPRAKKICRLILNKKLKFYWSPVTGIRIDTVDEELLQLMKQTGCYRVYFGIESGNQKILDNIGKGITIEQIRRVINWCRKNKLETVGFFMLALPGETAETMQDTVNFARELNLDLAKVTVTIPLPGTKLFDDLKSQNLIKSTNWSDYNLYIPARKIYDHPNLDWDVVDKYFNKFYRNFYLNPFFIAKRAWKSILDGKIISDIKYFFQTKW